MVPRPPRRILSPSSSKGCVSRHDTSARRLKDTSIAVRCLVEADAVYNIPELLGHILGFCDWRTVMSVSRTDPIGRSVARWVIQERIRFILQPFVPAECFNSFLTLLHDTGSAVVGSIIRRLLALNSGHDVDIPQRLLPKLNSSHDINLLVQAENADAWVDWYTNQGYGGWRYVAVYEGYTSSVDSVMLGLFPRLGRKVRLNSLSSQQLNLSFPP